MESKNGDLTLKPRGNSVDYFLKKSLSLPSSHHLLPNARFCFKRRHGGVQGYLSLPVGSQSLRAYLQLKPAMVQVCCDSNKILSLLVGPRSLPLLWHLIKPGQTGRDLYLQTGRDVKWACLEEPEKAHSYCRSLSSCYAPAAVQLLRMKRWLSCDHKQPEGAHTLKLRQYFWGNLNSI